jgi:site-specific DNA recombinase
MIAAIYARKSTVQDGVVDEAKSVERQIAGARTFIRAQGWTLDERHVYKDDGVSGALFANRAEFQRMMRDAAAGAFEAVLFYDLDRFGRHAHKTMVALHALADLGVTVWDFSTGVRVDLDSFEGRITTNLRAEFAQQFRDQIRKHTRDAMRRKAEAGHVTGGKVFGYDNVRVSKGRTDRVPNEAEAAVIRDIYRRFAAGEGIRTIAGALNKAGLPSPRAQQGRACGWSASTIGAVLDRPLYRGEIVYGRCTKAYGRELGRGAKREKGQIRQPENTWIRIEAPALRIIDHELIARVDSRRHDRRTRYLASKARGNGIPERAHGKYLLSGGMLICPSCGGHFEARKYPWKGNPGSVYSCATRRRKPGVCNNTLSLPIAQTDDEVLSIVEGEVLGTRLIDELLALVDRGDSHEWDRLLSDRDRFRGEIERLVGSIAVGVPADSVAPAIREREAEIARLETRLRVPRKPIPNIERLREALTLRAEEWKAELRSEPQVARLVLRRLIGPLTLWEEPRPEFIRWEASPKTELLEDLAPTLHMASPAGFEPAFWP